jgi:hypothetical protein
LPGIKPPSRPHRPSQLGPVTPVPSDLDPALPGEDNGTRANAGDHPHAPVSGGIANGNGHAADRADAAWLGDLAPHIPQADASSPCILSASAGFGEISLSADAHRPVFVLTVARSGSTLLRFILDSHPELACPPETNVGQTCFGLARLWDILEPSPESAARNYAPNEVPSNLTPEAAASIRGVVDAVYGRYVARHGKRRWCDKSLDSCRMAGLLAKLYPAAQFICLYRHCMDVVVSAIDAAPWGLNGYGFDLYVAGTPGNAALAAARCWLDQTKAIIDFQASHPDSCHGIRYEDLVTQPEEIAGNLFSFLGVAAAPGITQSCLTKARDTRGPGDHKIWFTSRISADSLGQGAKVPVQMLPPEFLANLNETLEQLSYRQIDDAWRSAPGPADPRADAPATAAQDSRAAEHDAETEAAAAEIARRLVDIPAGRARELAGRWPGAAARTLCLAIEPSAGGAGGGRRWSMSYTDGDLTVREEAEPLADASTLVAAAGTWLALFGGTANMAAELRAGRLRFSGSASSQDAGRQEQWSGTAHLLAHLLGLAGSGDTSSIEVPNGRER